MEHNLAPVMVTQVAMAFYDNQLGAGTLVLVPVAVSMN